MAILQATTISGSINDTGSLQITGSTLLPPQIESSLTSSFTSSGLLWINADNFNIQYTTETSKGSIQSPASFMGAWAAGGAQSRSPSTLRGIIGVGMQNAALAMGGVPDYDAVESYNGTSWATENNMSCCGFQFAAAGDLDSALAMGLYPDRQKSSEWNGSTWSNGTSIPVGVRLGVGGGFANSAWVYGQHPSKTATLHWNGSAWSSHATIGLSGNQYGGGVGSIGAALSTRQKDTYVYNGITWDKTNNRNSEVFDSAAAGQQDAAVAMGGRNPASVACTEEYNGSSWVQSCIVPVTNDRHGGLGGPKSRSDAALSIGGYQSGIVYEYTKSNIVPYTTSVWSNGAGNIFNKSAGMGAGDANAALSFAGNISPSVVACTEEYDGTNWSAGGAMIIARHNHGGTGTANAALAAGGEPASCCKAEEYNGSSWSTGGNLSQGGYGNATLGTQNSAINFGGNYTGKKAESYDGSSWSTISDMNCCRRASGGGAGTSNAAIVFGGRCYTAPTTCQLTISEEWNGSSWSFGGSYTTAASNGIAGGETVSTALSAGGYHPSDAPTGGFQTELYNGTSWSSGATALNLIKYSAGHSVGDSGFAVGGNPGSQNNIAQFYEATCSTTMCNAFGAWSAGGSLIIARNNHATAGTQNAAVTYGGQTPSLTNTTEEYDGSSFSAGGAMSIARDNLGRGGTQNAALASGGSTGGATNATEEYDGSSWSGGGNMITARLALAATGLQDAAIAAGGRTPTVVTCGEEYNGSSWSSGGNLITGRRSFEAAGTQNAAVVFGGYSHPNFYTCTEEYNGSAWSAGGALINCVWTQGGGGVQYAAISFGGRNPGDVNKVEEYNGSTWSVGKYMNQARGETSGTGTQTAALAVGGITPSVTAFVEEYNCTTTGNCVGVWSAAATVIAQRDDMHFGSVGSQNSTALFSGRTSPTNTTATEEYDGSSWSVGGAVITARYVAGSTGTVNAGLLIGGNNASGTCLDDTEEYNGTSWASGGNLAVGNNFLTGTGTQNAGVAFGGMENSRPASGFVCNRHYDGSSWSAAGGSLSVGKYASGGTGTQNATLAFGGYTAPSSNGYQTPKACTEEYDGSSWSTKTRILLATGAGNSAGTSNDALFMAGYTHPAQINYNQSWDGTTWSTTTFLPKSGARIATGGTSSTSAIVTGGLNRMGVFEFNCSNLLGAGLSIQRTEVSSS